MYRFIVLIGSAGCPAAIRATQSMGDTFVSNAPATWSSAGSMPGTRVFYSDPARSSGPSAYVLPGGRGVILGRLFRRAHSDYSTRASISFTEGDALEIIRSGGQMLVDEFWGSYVAILYDASARKHLVLSEPTGTLPCYRVSKGDVDIFFSHVEDCTRFLSIPFEVDPTYLRRWLIYSGLKNRECGLSGVEHIVGGECLTLEPGGTSRRVLWTAAEKAQSADLEDPAEAAEHLRTAVQTSVNAWASCYETITHKLSGGLDSSILAACLANAPSRPRLNCINFAASVRLEEEALHLLGMDAHTASQIRSLAGTGDETQYARAVASRWGLPLIERQRLVAMDLRRLWRAPLTVAPAMYFTAIEVDDAEIELVREFGTQAFFSGQAGDSVLLATIQPYAAMDYSYTHGFSAQLWKHLLASARLSKESIWTLLVKCIRHGTLGLRYSPSVGIISRPHLLRDEVAAMTREEHFEGHWARVRTRLPPGKRQQLRGLEGTDYYDYVFHSQHADHIDPLNSQPVWEVALRIPTYTLLTGGVSRGLARRAFADWLPPEIRKRVVKGTGTPFYQRVVRTNRESLLETLMDGVLAKEGYLDRVKVEKCLRSEEPFLVADACDILSYLSAEIWLQTWRSLSRSSSEEARYRPIAIGA